MSARPKNHHRLRPSLAALIAGITISLATVLPHISTIIHDIDRRLGDLALYQPATTGNQQLLFIGIDDDSLTLSGLDPQLVASDPNLSRMAQRFPWDRRVYAETILKLITADAGLVILDLLLTGPSNPQADSELANLIALHPDRIILASSFAPLSINDDAFTLIEPFSPFLEAGATHGYINFRPHRRDGIIREVEY